MQKQQLTNNDFYKVTSIITKSEISSNSIFIIKTNKV